MELLWRWFWTLIPANPLLVRVVHGGSGRLRHLWVRLGYLGTLIVLVMFGLLTGGGMAQDATLVELAKSGSQVFFIVAYGQVVLICLLSPLFMSGAIAAEKAEATFDIMLTTPMSNLQIVLGSLLGRLFFVWALLASGIPLFSVLLILGGIPISSVFVSFGTAAFSALLMGAVAITLSVLRAGGRKAVFVFVIAVAAYLVTGYVLDVALLRRWLPVVPDGTTFLTPLHPILVLEAFINRANYRPPTADEVALRSELMQFYYTRPFAVFAILSCFFSMALIVWSAVRIRSLETGGGFKRTLTLWLRRRLNLATAAPGESRTRAPRTVSDNPIAWREANTRGRLLSGLLAQWGYAFFAILSVIILVVLYHTQSLPTITAGTGAALGQAFVFRQALMTIMMLELAVVTLVAIYMSAGSVSREREDGTLDLMLTTPITPKQYIWGKLRGLVNFLALLLMVPVISLAIVALYALIAQSRGWATGTVNYSFQGNTGTGPLMLIEAPVLLALMLVPFIAGCVALGMHYSLKSKTVIGAVVWSIGILSFLAVAMGFCGFAAVGEIPLLGPILNGFSPATNVLMVLNPWETVDGFLNDQSRGNPFSRVTLFIAALVVAVGYFGFVYSMIFATVSGFDTTVRKLSGTGG